MKILRMLRWGFAGALALAASIGHANPTLVATIYGVYDAEDGIGDLPSGVTNGLSQYGSSGVYDTPSLFFVNPTGYSITGAQVVLTVSPVFNSGQNTLNNGVSQTIGLGTINPLSVTQFAWGYNVNQSPLGVYDYDDEYSQNYGAGIAGNSGSYAADCTLNTIGGQSGWSNFCAPVGNFGVQFSGVLSGAGLLNGQSVAAVFSEFDINDVYTGWEGLDPLGWSENLLYDVHSGTVSGVLANIYVGTTDTVPGSPNTAIPEPQTLPLVGLALFLISRKRRRP